MDASNIHQGREDVSFPNLNESLHLQDEQIRRPNGSLVLKICRIALGVFFLITAPLPTIIGGACGLFLKPQVENVAEKIQKIWNEQEALGKVAMAIGTVFTASLIGFQSVCGFLFAIDLGTRLAKTEV